MMAQETPKPPAQDVMRVGTIDVSCDGRSVLDPLGHPVVYLNMGDKGQVSCPYCRRLFVFTDQSEFEG
jgi:uncharacterized Zn-finger protein